MRFSQSGGCGQSGGYDQICLNDDCGQNQLKLQMPAHQARRLQSNPSTHRQKGQGETNLSGGSEKSGGSLSPRNVPRKKSWICLSGDGDVSSSSSQRLSGEKNPSGESPSQKSDQKMRSCFYQNDVCDASSCASSQKLSGEKSPIRRMKSWICLSGDGDVWVSCAQNGGLSLSGDWSRDGSLYVRSDQNRNPSCTNSTNCRAKSSEQIKK